MSASILEHKNSPINDVVCKIWTKNKDILLKKSIAKEINTFLHISQLFLKGYVASNDASTGCNTVAIHFVHQK